MNPLEKAYNETYSTLVPFLAYDRNHKAKTTQIYVSPNY